MENYLKYLMEDIDEILRVPRYIERMDFDVGDLDAMGGLPDTSLEEEDALFMDFTASGELYGFLEEEEEDDEDDDDDIFLFSVYEEGLRVIEEAAAIEEDFPDPDFSKPLKLHKQHPKSFASFCGLDLAAFPEERLLNERQLRSLSDKIAELFQYYNLEPIFRTHLPVRRAYVLLLHCLSTPQPIVQFGTLYLNFCSGDLEGCMHEEFCACAKTLAEMEAEEQQAAQLDANKEEDKKEEDFPDKRAS
ncbi:MAG: hypothetical protein ACXIT9_13500 [Nitritalea sp.]